MADYILRSGDRVDLLLCGVRFTGLRLFARLEDAGVVELLPDGEAKACEGGQELAFSQESLKLTGRVRITQEEGVARVRFSAGAKSANFAPEVSFTGRESLSLAVSGIEGADALLAEALFSPWWTKPFFPKTLSGVPEKTQQLLCRIGVKGHLFLQPLTLPGSKADLSGCETGLRLTAHTNETGYARVEGLMACAADGSPFEAVRRLYDACHRAGEIVTPLRAEKEYPEMAKYLGWCSWNTFYYNVSEAGLFQKLDEFREKGIPLRWMLIDAGWSPVDTSNEMLTGFDADGAKFPRGLSGAIAEAKARFGLRWVGVWHTFNGFWNGVEPDSPAAREMAETLSATRSGWLVPGFRFAQAFEFFNTWHRRLRAQGVDFVKVDNQSSAIRYTRNSAPVSAIRAAHEALEASVRLNFPAPLINCMGMATEDTFARDRSVLNRNSDDFFPDRQGSFVSHIMQNVYNAVFQGQLYVCDFDMWWTRHESAVVSGVLRAISGGPVYVSDKVSETDPDKLWPIIDGEGRILRCDHAALPAPSCLYENVPEESGVLKLTNRAGQNAVTALFNLTDEPRAAVLRREDTECSEGVPYLAHLYFGGRYVPFDGALELTLPAGGVEIVNLYPIDGDGYARVGDPAKYIGAACTDACTAVKAGDARE